MYNAYFGFSESPFSLSPDPAFFYRSEQHEEALANLIYGVQSRKGFIVLTGEVGTGKTTMLECLRDFLDSQYIEFAFIFNSRITSDQFFEMIAYDLDLRCDRKSKWEVLEEIRLLGNLENRRGKLIQVILAGQPELDRKLEAPNLRQLKQRIVLRCNLEPFSADDTAQYVASRLEKAGLPDQTVFTPEILADVHLRAQGIPRLINAICDNLLLTCFALETKVATVSMLDEVSKDMRLEWAGRRPRGERSRYSPQALEE